jgi:ribosomal protein S18 acetylase RimI-like enzyme
LKEQDRSLNKEIMLGSIISRVKVGNDDIICIQRRIDEIALSKQSYFTQLVSSLICKNIFGGQSEEDLNGMYIMTLGVIDECRQLGIGTKLLD